MDRPPGVVVQMTMTHAMAASRVPVLKTT